MVNLRLRRRVERPVDLSAQPDGVSVVTEEFDVVVIGASSHPRRTKRSASRRTVVLGPRVITSSTETSRPWSAIRAESAGMRFSVPPGASELTSG
jgi:hypothetical protein